MFANASGPRSALRRRGIVLVLVLGMLGLMALIGVTFATFAGQSLRNARNFGQGIARPQAEAMMDYALSQLINDTNNPLSALRGHSLLRDMYGNDSVFRGSNPPQNAVAETGGLLTRVFDGGLTTLHFTFAQPRSAYNTTVATPFYNQIQYRTNIPVSGPYAGYDFTRWVVILGNAGVPQSFEVLEDIPDTGTGYHLFTLAANLGNPTVDQVYQANNASAGAPLASSDSTAHIYLYPNQGATVTGGQTVKAYSHLAQEFNTLGGSNAGSLGGGVISNAFVLDGRHMRAFNGPGLTRPAAYVQNRDANGNLIANSNYPFNQAAFANMRIAGIDPDATGMDEDYDACDLENWFLAIQSADGQVMIPSFHRPGILTATDWTVPAFDSTGATIAANVQSRSKILRPRQIDNSPLFPYDPSTLDSDGKLTYDVDNDGDGVTDSVWLDLGYPVQRDPNGKLYKPLFAFMILGLNGRLPLNTVGNLQARAIGDATNNGADSVPYANSSGQVPYPGLYTSTTLHNSNYSSQVFFDAPLYDHASHLGYSVNEINPKFALQNAPSNLYAGTNATAFPQSGYGDFNNAPPGVGVSFSQVDDAGVSVATTQLRNLLAGGRPTSLKNPFTGGLPANMSPQVATTTPFSGDVNIVAVNGQPWVFPNGLYDIHDVQGTNPNTSNPATAAGATAVPGRWGEPQGIPNLLPSPADGGLAFDTTYPNYWYNNPVRAGRSVYTGGVADPFDDDFDSFDPYQSFDPGLNNIASAAATFTLTQDATTAPTNLSIPLNVAGPYTAHTFNRNYPEDVDTFDATGQRAVAAERERTFVTPRDPAGVGRMVSYMARPDRDSDYGKGADTFGRAGYFRYFRPAGLPQEVRYPYVDVAANPFPFPYATGSGTGRQFLLPVLLPAGQSVTTGAAPASKPDTSNNLLHGYQAAATPTVAGTAYKPQTIAVMGAMPYDWDPAVTPPGSYPNGYIANISLYTPTIAPINAVGTFVNSLISSEPGPNLGGTIGGSPTGYPIPYLLNGGTYTGPGGAPTTGLVVNGYLGGSLNKDEADELNLYSPGNADMPYGPTDLEWLYRKHDVDGATLTSRLSGLAPISFLNPVDGLTRRRLFSTDSWELNSIVYANDNPVPYAGIVGGQGMNLGYGSHSPDHDFTYNSRFMPNASPSFEIMNQVVSLNTTLPQFYQFANPFTTEFLPNPTLPTNTSTAVGPSPGSTFGSYVQNSLATARAMPQAIDHTLPNTTALPYNMFGTNAFINATVDPYTNVIVPYGANSAAQVQTPSVAHRDRKINLNFPLPISNDPAEPIRQKWCRETYQLLKAILPPASVDTPEELAALSQFVVNIVDFRDPDPTMTRFVNTDLEVVDVLTKRQSSVPDPTRLDTTFNVSPGGVRFAQASHLTGNQFPYDPSIYSPDRVTPYLVQHGMEYNPIAINEVFAFKSRYGLATSTGNLPDYRGLFIELVNTLNESQNSGGLNNSSAISLAGWDIIIAPDNFGWGRPDPISGDISPFAYPPNLTTAAAKAGLTNTATEPPARQQRPAVNQAAPLSTVQRLEFKQDIKKIAAMSGNTANYYVIGGYSGSLTATTVERGTPAVGATIDASLTPTDSSYGLTRPNANDGTATSVVDNLTPPATGQGLYYWVYLRRPANPFDTAQLTVDRPNREMVVVDAMRFPYIDSGNAVVGNTPPVVTTTAPNDMYSAQRLQPYRGGHLLPVDTDVATGNTPTTAPDPNAATGTVPSPATGVAKICPPSPAYAYGYSEQNSRTANSNPAVTGKFAAAAGDQATTRTYNETIDKENNPKDTNWAHVPFHDRDFASVAELLLVPGCPPGLFTKQFVEEPYPGNNTGTGRDASDFTAGSIGAPAAANAGRPNFSATPTPPAVPTFPYLTDNFYYTAASVAPPLSGATLQAGYTNLTTEIGGWTGAGWHKMMEFFEVPSSANGATGLAANGVNYDWYREDIKPGLLNLNLIIDEEVFAGLIDDPRLNETLVAYSTNVVLPYVVSQVDAFGYPANNTTTGAITGRYPIFPIDLAHQSVNLVNGSTPDRSTAGRGYAYRDPNAVDYVTGGPYYYQQLHGIKAAFSDFLKLRHGGSGYLFAHGAGDVAMGSFFPSLTTPVGTTQPVAADRPFRSLSYPDINYTIFRPASLPPSPSNLAVTIPSPGTTLPLPTANPMGTPPITTGLANLFTYDPAATAPFVQFNQLLAPMNDTTGKYQYVQDPGIKNPYLAVQSVNGTTPTAAQPTTDPFPSARRLAPPYDAMQRTTASGTPPFIPIAAPFPPPIPPTPARRLFQIADNNALSNAGDTGGFDSSKTFEQVSPVNVPVSTPALSQGANASTLATPLPPTPPNLVLATRAIMSADNYTPTPATAPVPTPIANNYLGAGATGTVTDDLRQHPAYRTEWLQKVSNLTTVRTHQFATWITVGFFEVTKVGTPELGIPDQLGQEMGGGAGNRTRYRSFFVLDRTRATGFNPYYPGDFRDCVVHRSRIE